MFGIGLPELILIMVVALLVVGPKKLPELARSLGKAMGDFKRMADDVKQTFEEEAPEKGNDNDLLETGGPETMSDGETEVPRHGDGMSGEDPDPSDKNKSEEHGELRG